MAVWRPLELEPGLHVDLESNGRALTKIWFGTLCLPPEDRDDNHPILRQTTAELREYMAGQREEFTVPLELTGTEFQREVWQELCKIPYGKTCRYIDIANAIGKPKAVRAVGAANGSNPVPIIVPCHRVIGSDGTLTGYGGGLPLKRRLLQLEGILLL
jgi:methylated-DNA-[protein]-cysteine S-methyltransferase